LIARFRIKPEKQFAQMPLCCDELIDFWVVVKSGGLLRLEEGANPAGLRLEKAGLAPSSNRSNPPDLTTTDFWILE